MHKTEQVRTTSQGNPADRDNFASASESTLNRQPGKAKPDTEMVGVPKPSQPLPW